MGTVSAIVLTKINVFEIHLCANTLIILAALLS